VEQAVQPRLVTVASDIRQYPAALALAFLAALYGLLPLLTALRAARPGALRPQTRLQT
jgi:hypothetical protein